MDRGIRIARMGLIKVAGVGRGGRTRHFAKLERWINCGFDERRATALIFAGFF